MTARSWTRLGLAALVAAVALASACTTDGNAGSSDSTDGGGGSGGDVTSSTPAWPPLDEAAARAAALDVRAEGCGPRIGFGAGSMIDSDLAVTAAHVVAGSDRIEVIDVDGRSSRAEVVWFDPGLDLALLRTRDPVGEPVDVRPAAATAGESGVVVLPRRSDGVVEIDVAEVEVLRTVRINTTDIYLDADVTRQGFELAAEIDAGDSGGVVVLPGGAVGLVWAKSNAREDRAWAIDFPAVVTDPAGWAGLVEPVDTAACAR